MFTPLVDCILNFDGQCAGVAMEILRLNLEAVKAVSVLDVESRDASHNSIFVYNICEHLTNSDSNWFSQNVKF